MMDMQNLPSYAYLSESGELKVRAKALIDRLEHCDICPRRCGVNRLNGQVGFCGSGRWAVVSSVCDHHGEEPPISGKSGSGTIFLGHCNLRCVFCQNHQISQPEDKGLMEQVDADVLANQMLSLQAKGCHNINWVSPTHFVPQLVEALAIAAGKGLSLPVVYNTNAYDSVDTLKELEGIVDIYLPDIKYSSDAYAESYSEAINYVMESRCSIREMYRQVGNLVIGDDDIAKHGLLVRHLILPNGIAGSKDSLDWLCKAVSSDVHLSVMAQYCPCFKAGNYPELARTIKRGEYDEVMDIVDALAFENGWLQEMSSAMNFLPDFAADGHPFKSKVEEHKLG
jgi:putative pyruvate formate lyase activating enzyme